MHLKSEDLDFWERESKVFCEGRERVREREREREWKKGEKGQSKGGRRTFWKGSENSGTEKNGVWKQEMKGD